MAASDPSWEQDTQGTELGLWPPQTDLVVKNWLDDQRLALMNTDPLYDTLEQVIDVDETYQRQPFDLQDITKKYTNIGGTFIKYYYDSPYKWDLSAWLCLNSK